MKFQNCRVKRAEKTTATTIEREKNEREGKERETYKMDNDDVDGVGSG
jgi:hypothetical protein